MKKLPRGAGQSRRGVLLYRKILRIKCGNKTRGYNYERYDICADTANRSNRTGIDYERGVSFTSDWYSIRRIPFTGLNPVHAVETVISIMGDKIGGNVNILLFLSFLGIVVALITKSGASRAYGEWAARSIKSRRGALWRLCFRLPYLCR